VKDKEVLLQASRGVGLEVNTEKTSIRLFLANKMQDITIIFWLLIIKFKYFGMTVTNQNCIYKEIKSRLNSGNACYHSVQDLFSSCLLTKNVKIKIHRTAILPADFVLEW